MVRYFMIGVHDKLCAFIRDNNALDDGHGPAGLELKPSL